MTPEDIELVKFALGLILGFNILGFVVLYSRGYLINEKLNEIRKYIFKM